MAKWAPRQRNDRLWIPTETVPCELDPELWSEPDVNSRMTLDEKGKPLRLRKAVQMALEICNTTCPLRDECLAAAMHDEGDSGEASRFGIRGGLLPSQRAKLGRKTTRRTP